MTLENRIKKVAQKHFAQKKARSEALAELKPVLANLTSIVSMLANNREDKPVDLKKVFLLTKKAKNDFDTVAQRNDLYNTSGRENIGEMTKWFLEALDTLQDSTLRHDKKVTYTWMPLDRAREHLKNRIMLTMQFLEQGLATRLDKRFSQKY